MNTITPNHIADYRRDGFVVVENFLDQNELETWRRCTDEAVRQRLESSGAYGSSNEYYSQVFTQCIRLADSHSGMHELLFDPRLGAASGALSGAKGLRIWHDQALIKPPYGNPTAWHLDNPYWSFSSRDSLSIWGSCFKRVVVLS